MTKDQNPCGFVPAAPMVEDEVMVSMTMEEWAEEFKPFRNANKNGVEITIQPHFLGFRPLDSSF